MKRRLSLSEVLSNQKKLKSDQGGGRPNFIRNSIGGGSSSSGSAFKDELSVTAVPPPVANEAKPDLVEEVAVSAEISNWSCVVVVWTWAFTIQGNLL